mmetsp:Transcript_1965/g.5722  ORF Transcript_1965/g.5722 Transcript_1965/m.5722 type:complete len:248 (-) Transcript_1965:140-883(-)
MYQSAGSSRSTAASSASKLWQAAVTRSSRTKAHSRPLSTRARHALRCDSAQPQAPSVRWFERPPRVVPAVARPARAALSASSSASGATSLSPTSRGHERSRPSTAWTRSTFAASHGCCATIDSTVVRRSGRRSRLMYRHIPSSIPTFAFAPLPRSRGGVLTAWVVSASRINGEPACDDTAGVETSGCAVYAAPDAGDATPTCAVETLAGLGVAELHRWPGAARVAARSSRQTCLCVFHAWRWWSALQ